MAEKKYTSFIDQFLEDAMPDYEEVGLAGAVDSGKEQLDRTHQYVEEDFLEGLSDDTNQHTQGPAGGKGTRTGSQQADDRAAGKESAFPRIRASQTISRTAKALGDESVFSDVVMELEEAKGHGFNDKREVTEAEIQRYVKTLLNGGMPPVKVAAKLEKLAELQLFNKGMATDYLNRNAGLLGLAYIQPNEYMNKCPDTYERLKVKGAGKIAAKSVKQINACEGCMFFAKDASSKTCNLYHLPIVGTQNELLTVVNKMTAGVPAKSKKAALVRIANKDEQRTPVINHVVSSRPSQRVYNTSPDQARQANKTAVVREITASDIEKLHVAGNTLEKIYNFVAKKVGSAKAGHAVREFVASLKSHNTKIALSQIDCTFLKGKLAVQNAIVGAAKCGSCTYRQGMHCGMTGGTLVSFPGMDHQASNHKIAADAPKDGKAMLQEYDLTTASEQPDIEFNAAGPERQNVQMGSTAGMADIE